MRLHGPLATLLILVTSPLCAQSVSTPAQTFIGQGRGVDHVGVVVRDLAHAQHDYEQLGFKVSKGGHFPGGVSNSVVYFQNDSYLELLTVNGTESAKQSDAAALLWNGLYAPARNYPWSFDRDVPASQALAIKSISNGSFREPIWMYRTSRFGRYAELCIAATMRSAQLCGVACSMFVWQASIPAARRK